MQIKEGGLRTTAEATGLWGTSASGLTESCLMYRSNALSSPDFLYAPLLTQVSVWFACLLVSVCLYED